MKISILLPPDVKCLLKIGQNTDFNTPFFKKSLKNDKEFNIANLLDIPPDKIFSHLTKLVGEKIGKNEIIAFKKNLLHKMTITSDVDGTIKEINHLEGKIVIETENENVVQNCFFKGIVTSLERKEIEIEIKNPKSFELKSVNRDFGGKCFYIKEKIGPGSIKSSFVFDSVVICESLNSFHQTKIEALGGKGYVTLKKLQDDTKLGNAQIKLIEDLDKIFSNNLTYCLITQKNGKIFFYN